ncbi:MAG: hypothetical protein D6693_04695 [Planctomycetota bacterium]|nr:MAG: hypothetical protein D6693_04695 [Planctomycetota bacterium]
MTARFITAAIAALATGAPAIADSVDLRFLGTGAGRTVSVSLGGDSFRVFAGQLCHELSDGVGLAGLILGEHLTYCAELTEHVTTIARRYDLVPLAQVSTPALGATRASAITGLYSWVDGAQLEAGADRDLAAAFQIAVWEIIYDYDDTEGAGALDVESGRFRARSRRGRRLNDSIRGYLDSMFAAALAPPASSGWALAGLTRQGAQDQLIGLPMAAVPLPGAATAGLVGLGVIASRRRRTF